MTEPRWLAYARSFNNLREVPGLTLASHSLFSRTLWGPTERVNAVEERVLTDTKSRSDIRDTHGLSVDHETNGRLLVRVLLGANGPSAVIRRVWSVVIDTLKGCANGPNSHVGDKVSERFQPPFADVNSASAIVHKFFAVGRVAAPLHFGPTGHCRRVGESMTPHLGARLALLFGKVARATSARLPGAQIAFQNIGFRSAGAAHKALSARSNNRPCPVSFHDDMIPWEQYLSRSPS
jgi:hypothetical protein